MLFYDCSTAPNPRRARMFIAEKGLDIETIDISIANNEQRSEEFLKVNPLATLPVLITDEQATIIENVAIATYLEARFPVPPLMGLSPEEKAAVAMWNAICESHGGMAVGEAFCNSHPAMAGRALPGTLDLDQIPELAERGRKRVAGFFDLLEKRLSQSEWLAGDAFSMADITGFVFTDFARVIKTRIPEENAATLAWFARIRARPSAQL
ncbi:glutathione S-transferase [Aquicoccus sp. G2-2]|uniref:glutathione S-transferase family protein n=1 Tax=Aquicoccus sp. G2-2 TaxID=3092120 RepID=UPI002ADF8B84|nr:glutathione S-transferase [Aquicoccus sp. G2-2]MEA1113605.1 glutathione S-transferase [Aquicoccus sp. G2-2]